MIRYPIDCSKYEIQKSNFGFWDRLNVNFDSKWRIDHGVWCVLCKMYPDADIPTVEMSINRKLDMQQHYEMGKKLYRFREEGILILCTGNVVHNLTMVNMSGSPYKWAISYDEKVKKYITSGKRGEENKIRYCQVYEVWTIYRFDFSWKNI